MPSRLRLSVALSVIVCVAALVAAAPASASTVQLSGVQTLTDPATGTFDMEGSLIGTWYTTGFEITGVHPKRHRPGDWHGALRWVPRSGWR